MRNFLLKWSEAFEKDFYRFVERLPGSVQFFLSVSMLFHLMEAPFISLIETVKTDSVFIAWLLLLFFVEKKGLGVEKP